MYVQYTHQNISFANENTRGNETKYTMARWYPVVAIVCFLGFFVYVLQTEQTLVLRSLFERTVASQNNGDAPRYRRTAATQHHGGTTINVLMCMSGAGEGFLEETKVAIKSVILNAPHQGALNLFIMADQAAYDALPKMFGNISLQQWWCPLSFHVINVESHTKGWDQEIENVSKTEMVDRLHTVGTYFRLFMNRVLPSDVKHVLYMDPDVIVTANLVNLWNNATRDDKTLFSWRRETAGFMMIRNTPELWELVAQINPHDLPKVAFNDQKILLLIAQEHPDRVNELPPAWGFHWAWDWRSRKRMETNYPQLAMGHFNGGADRPGPFWMESPKTDFELYPEWSTMFLYYIRLPWTHARFIGESTGRTYPCVVLFHNDTSALAS